jgi:hypothetical protein
VSEATDVDPSFLIESQLGEIEHRLDQVEQLLIQDRDYLVRFNQKICWSLITYFLSYSLIAVF